MENLIFANVTLSNTVLPLCDGKQPQGVLSLNNGTYYDFAGKQNT